MYLFRSAVYWLGPVIITAWGSGGVRGGSYGFLKYGGGDQP